MEGGGSVLVSTLKGYELDAYVELWYMGFRTGCDAELIEIPSEGRVLCRIKRCGLTELLGFIEEAMRGRPWELRYVKKLWPISGIYALKDLGRALSDLNGRLRTLGSDFTLKVEVVMPRRSRGFSKDYIIGRVMEGLAVTVDLENPQVIALVFLLGNRALIGLWGPVSVLGIKNR